MAQIGVTFFVDHHFGIIRNQFSLTELVRKDLKSDEHQFTFRHIVSKNISSMCRTYPSKLEDMRLFVESNDHNIFIIGLGASDYKSGYSYTMFRNHIKGILSEIHIIDSKSDVVFLNMNILNNLKGNFKTNYVKMSSIVNELSKEHNCFTLVSDLRFLFLNNGDYVVSTKTIPNLISDISEIVINILSLK
tara:strand:+ start:648 stop:1217 length:570 start_codon:yes stop_codon:yes gene_type:complete